MPLICDCCGKKVFKYAVYQYDAEYLEKYLEDYFQRSIDDARNKNIVRKQDRMFRAICLFVFKKYGRFSTYNVSRQFGLSTSSVREFILTLDTKDHDFRFIDKDLSDNLPEVFKE